jgi:hypothetical protein
MMALSIAHRWKRCCVRACRWLRSVGASGGMNRPVAYWVEKYGLEAVNRDKVAAKGGLAREELEPLVAAGMTIAEIAQVVKRSKRQCAIG